MPIAVDQFAQPCRNISAKIDNCEICAFPKQLALSSHAPCSDNGGLRQRSETAPMFRNHHIIHRCARKNRGDFCVWVHFTRKIFCAMNRNIDISGDKRSLDLRREQSLATSLTLEQSD